MVVRVRLFAANAKNAVHVILRSIGLVAAASAQSLADLSSVAIAQSFSCGQFLNFNRFSSVEERNKNLRLFSNK